MPIKKNAIMIADTRPALIGHILLQIKETNPSLFDEALIFYDEITKKDMDIMSKIMPCTFVKYDYEFPNGVVNLPSFQKFSHLMFSRYEMFSLLDKYKTITWIDTDVLIVGKLDAIIEKANKYGMVANFENENDMSYKKVDYVSTSFVDNYKSDYDLKKYNMSSGIISVSDKLNNKNDLTSWCYDKTIELANWLVLPDQAILNIFLQEFNINIEPAGENGAYCVYPYNGRDVTNAKIIHAWGSRKFWSNWYLYLKYPKWGEIYNKWLKMGGSSFLKEDIQPAISIIMPTYKPNLDYLKECLDSVLEKQIDEYGFDFDNNELILLAEPFDIKELTELISSYDDPRINLIVNPERLGIAKSLNIGIKTSKAKYIARMDDDDISDENRLFLQNKYLNEHKEIQLVTSNYEYFGDLNEKRLSLSGKMSQAWSIFTCPFDHPTIMFRKSFFIENNLFYDENRKFVEDWELWLRAFDKGMNVGSVNKILYYHRWHNGQAGQNSKSIDMMYELIKNNFSKLNVNIDNEDLKFIGPWQGGVNEEQYITLENYFSEALENNQSLNYYNQRALKKVFDMRLQEAATGKLDSLIIYKDKINENKMLYIVKKMLYPFYKPFKNKMTKIASERVEILEERIAELEDEIEYLKRKIK